MADRVGKDNFLVIQKKIETFYCIEKEQLRRIFFILEWDMSI